MDTADLGRSFDGFGAQIWPGDSKIQNMLPNLNIKYVRMCPGGGLNPPTNATIGQMDSYMSSEYNGTTRGNAIITTLQMTEARGIKMIFNMFGGFSNWLGTDNVLQSQYFDDFARMWASQVYFFTSRGYTIDYIELANEPEGDWNIKIPAWSYNSVVKLVRSELDSRGLSSVKIIGPGLAYLYYGLTWIPALDTDGKNAIAAWSTHAWDEGWGHTSAEPSFLDDRWQNYFGAAVNYADAAGEKKIIVTEYATGVTTYNGTTYGDEVTNTAVFGQRCFENTLTLANNGANVLCYWEAASQSWETGKLYGLMRVNTSYRPVYYAFRTLFPYVPDDAKMLNKTWSDSDISAAGFIGSNKAVFAFANSTDTVQQREIALLNLNSIVITRALRYANGTVYDVSNEVVFDYDDESFSVNLPAESTLTVMADINNCSGILPGDLNSDCKVNFYDFDILASDWPSQSMQDMETLAENWLDCVALPQSDCWQ